jgi:hypothetical protein
MHPRPLVLRAPRAGSARWLAADALAFVEERGVVLVSAKGSEPSLVEAIAGRSIKGSWWADPEGRRIYAVLAAVTESEHVLVCRLVNGKSTLVHRRLWPALARLASRFPPERLARVRQEHTASGHHENHEIAFAHWLPAAIAEEARALDEEEALAAFAPWLAPPSSSAKKVRRPVRSR